MTGTGTRFRGSRGALGIGEALRLDVPDDQIDALTSGQHIHHGQYVIHGVLGRGSFATVYDAEHLGLARRVAIKVPLLHVDKKALLHERFLREARSAALVQHPNVLAIYDAGSLLDGTPFLVLERVEGDSLSERIAHGPLAIDLVIEIGRQLAKALSALAVAGIVHRDIKPANVMLHRDGSSVPQVKLVDLGVAKRRASWQQQALRLTMQGELIGTPQYMASEQLRGEEADSRTDIYGVAAVLYEALTGRPPHESSDFSEYMLAALSKPVLPVRTLRTDCPPMLEQTLLRALDRDREHRQASADQLLAELELCKGELESRAVVLEEECAVVSLALPTESALVPLAVAPELAPAQLPVVASAQPTELPYLWQASPSRERTHRWFQTSQLTPFPRVLIGLTVLLLLLGGSGALVMPTASPPEPTPPVAQPTATADLPEPAATDEQPGARAPTAAEPEPEPAPLPTVPFAPPVNLAGWDAPSALAPAPPDDDERADDVQPADDEEQLAADPQQHALEAPTSGRVERAGRPEAGRARLRSTLPLPKAESRSSSAPDVAARAGLRPPATRPGSAAAPSPAQRAALEASADSDPQAELAAALKAFASGRLQEAKAAYQNVLHGDARNTAGLRGLGLVAARLGETDVARTALRRYLELAPRAPDAAQISSRLAALAP